jgi:recombination protein RecA
MAAAHDVEALLAQLGTRVHVGRATEPVQALDLGWAELGAALPDGGLPRGVVELSAPRALGGATSVALAAVRAGQARAPGAWCAWMDPEGTLHAPGLVAAGVDLGRLLVVRVPREDLPRVAVKVVASGAFEVVVVDVDAVGGAGAVARGPAGRGKRGWPPEVLVRKLALAAEPCGATVLLSTDATKPRAVPWPVALRLELSRPGADTLSVRIGKDRRGRIGAARVIPFRPVVRAAV